MFAKNALKSFENTSAYYVKEINTDHSGRCYTVCKMEKMSRNETNYFDLKKIMDVRFYLHNRERIFSKTSEHQKQSHISDSENTYKRKRYFQILNINLHRGYCEYQLKKLLMAWHVPHRYTTRGNI